MSLRCILASTCLAGLLAAGPALAQETEGRAYVVMGLDQPGSVAINGQPVGELGAWHKGVIPMPTGRYSFTFTSGGHTASLEADLNLGNSTPGAGQRPYWCVGAGRSDRDPAGTFGVVMLLPSDCAALLAMGEGDRPEDPAN